MDRDVGPLALSYSLPANLHKVPPNPEQLARNQIETSLEAAGWLVTSVAQTNIHGRRGVAIRKFPLIAGSGFADYLLHVGSSAPTIAPIDGDMRFQPS